MHSTVIKLILACKALCLIPTWYTKIEIVFLPLCYLHRCTRRYFFNSALEQMTKKENIVFLQLWILKVPHQVWVICFLRLLCVVVVYNLSMLLLCHQTLPMGMFLMFMCPHLFSLKDTSQIC